MHAALIETKSRSISSSVERLVYLHAAYQASQKNSARSTWQASGGEVRSTRCPDAALAATIILPAAHQPAAHENQP